MKIAYVSKSSLLLSQGDIDFILHNIGCQSSKIVNEKKFVMIKYLVYHYYQMIVIFYS